MTLSILDAASDSDARRLFLSLPERVYRDDPHYCEPPDGSVEASLDRGDFAGRQAALVVVESGLPVARVAARVSPTLEDEDGAPLGLLGFFEALDRSDAVSALMGQALGWLRGRGAATVVGPMDGDTWHRYRLNAGPFDSPPFLLEPYNPPYYPAQWEGYGFRVLERYCSSRVEDLPTVVQRLEPKLRAVHEAGFRFQPIRLDRFERELERFYALSCSIFAGNILYTEIPQERFRALYAGARRLIDPDLVVFAVDPDGGDAGFLFALPDRFRAVQAMRGSRGPLALLRHVLNRRTDTVNLKSLGVLSTHRRSGLGTALMCHGYQVAAARGYSAANICLFAEGNPSGDLDGGLGSELRRYHLYVHGPEPTP